VTAASSNATRPAASHGRDIGRIVLTPVVEGIT
jgi:hypothetical protein